jgi:5-(carboxyamino)imidazole ribonucleotide mutase
MINKLQIVKNKNKPTPNSKKNLKKSSSLAIASSPVVSVIMGSKSDWETMREATEMLDQLDIEYEARIVSAHRTPDLVFEFAENAQARGIKVIIAGAGGAAHLPGMTASKTLLPVLGVPIQSKSLQGLDSLLSIVQMPGGIPVGTLAIGKAGAKNAALLAAAIISLSEPRVAKALKEYRSSLTASVLSQHLEPIEITDEAEHE